MSKRRRWLALGLILLLAAALRFWRLGDLPPGLYHDEAYNGLDALSLLDGQTFPRFYEGWELYAGDAHAERPPLPTRWPVFFEGNYGREPLHVYLMALSVRLFGPTPFALRAVPAAAGLLAVFATYLAAGELLGNGYSALGNRRPNPQSEIRNPKSPIPDPQSPLLAAFFIAILYPALTFSRFGIRAMLFPPVAALCVTCFWRGLRAVRARASWLALAGFFLGLGLYTYAAARLLPLLFVLFVPLWLWRERGARRFLPHLGLMAGTAVLTAAPLLWFFARYPYFFVFRTAYVANRGLGAVPDKPWLTWLNNVGRVIRGLFWQGETHLRHNLPGRPFLDPIQALFFASGLAGLLRRRRLQDWFLLIWLAVMLLPSILSGDAPHFGRMIGAVPVAAIIAARGVGVMSNFVMSKDASSLKITYYSLLITLLAASAALTIHAYFGRYAGHPQLAADFYQADWELGQFVAAQPADASLFLSPNQAEMATISFALGGDRDRLRSYAGTGELVPLGRPDAPALYLFRPEATAALANLRRLFPDGRLGDERDGFIPFAVPGDAGGLTAVRQTDVPLAPAISLVGWEAAQTDGRLVVTLVWQAMGRVERPATAFVHLLANGGLVAQRDRPPDGYPVTDWRPGELVRDRFHIDLPSDLPSGGYTLQTGFYDSATLQPLGETAVLGQVTIQ